ncbi:SMP-30/gluconolactonase/LRE family protein [Conexibacter sp. JD483]|uniref:SMP-30/gluconolactonase/LRE family protein n=1 Tax=unclassified Conexibacter TaxID=2627773 RepID=UPI0027171A41|nr:MULTISPECIES: SMP-30/gluconolactonase/LRE family protein [unclassified Conexibacter]MDO8187582.1 SMP-30/gluconolactonase/LRE family protein [Conexibacter sp. CPCC 205706]MDO8198948.1 SMP-30/gluconolactonase/LRE family protein [Conexibacter sp. CPCC 205762]MDR9370345.1 SMP-30/gluconolactonase/LRE family protein [Conexibacter sp. JD483]
MSAFAAAEALVPLARARSFHDGQAERPALRHPEGIAVAADGTVWCGSETGELHRIAAGGGAREVVGSTGGFLLGIAVDEAGDRVLACDAQAAQLVAYERSSGRLAPLEATRGLLVQPNFVVVDAARGCLFVSDSATRDGAPRPSIWRFPLDGGPGRICVEQPLHFANGLALSADGATLWVAETFRRQVVAIPLDAAGDAAGPAEVVADGLDGLPDGLVATAAGTLLVCCYEPSAVLAIAPGGAVRTLVADPEAHLLCRPTNGALDASGDLLLANFGGWHVTHVPLPAALGGSGA